MWDSPWCEHQGTWCSRRSPLGSRWCSVVSDHVNVNNDDIYFVHIDKLIAIAPPLCMRSPNKKVQDLMLELVTLRRWPFYLLQEFPIMLMVVKYIPPIANAKSALARLWKPSVSSKTHTRMGCLLMPGMPTMQISSQFSLSSLNTLDWTGLHLH